LRASSILHILHTIPSLHKSSTEFHAQVSPVVQLPQFDSDRDGSFGINGGNGPSLVPWRFVAFFGIRQVERRYLS
jgi:hypothetical protein